jgi:hypothetical protein
MKTVQNYLVKLQKENNYIHPVQTRPKPEPGISKEKIKQPPSGEEGPSGMEVDLDKDEISGYAFINKIFKGKKGKDYEDDI